MMCDEIPETPLMHVENIQTTKEYMKKIGGSLGCVREIKRAAKE